MGSRRLRECWDITSARQSARVVALLDECALFDTDPAASSYTGLLQEATHRLEKGLSDHAPQLFVANENILAWYASSARLQFLWRSCKIAHCALLLEGRLPDEWLSQLVLTEVFTNRMAPHLRAPRTNLEEMAIIERFVTSLPGRWFDAGLPAAMASLRDVLGPRAKVCAEAASTAKAAARVLQHMHCYDEAQVILNSLS